MLTSIDFLFIINIYIERENIHKEACEYVCTHESKKYEFIYRKSVRVRTFQITVST